MVVRISVGAALALLLTAGPTVNHAVAQERSVAAALSADTVALGGSFDVIVTVRGGGGMTPPQIGPFSFAVEQGRSTQSSIRMGPAGTETLLEIRYRYLAREEGTFEIPPFSVSVGGEEFETELMTLNISGELPQSAAPASAAPGEGAPGGGVLPAELFLTVDPPGATIYVGEPLVVEYRLWTQASVSSLSLVETPDPEGFWVEDVTDDDLVVEQRTLDGRSFTTAVVRRIALVPTGPGVRTVDRLGVEALVRRGGLGLFGMSRNERVPLFADGFTVTVEPLPAGAPEPFSGVVGSLSLSASLDRDSLAANDALTLTVRAAGRGNLRQLQPPALDLPSDVEVFPPEITESLSVAGGSLSGTREFEFVLVPRAPGRREIPAISLGYLDDTTDEYRVAATEAIPVTVSGTAGAAQGGIGVISPVREDIRHIHLERTTLRRSGAGTLGTPGFWMALLVPLASLAGAWGVGRRRDRLEGDVAYARQRRASRMARRRLRTARTLVAGPAREFYAEADRALRELVANRLDLAEAGLRTSEIAKALRGSGVGEEAAARAVAVLDRCDRERFAPTGRGPEQQRELLRDLARIMAELDRALRP